VTPDPGADELRIRSLLVARGVGPDAIPPKPTVPPKPAVRPRDWLDDILAADSDPAPAVEEAPEPEPEAASEPAQPVAPGPKPGKKKRKKPKAGAPRTAWDTQPPSPRQSLAEAWDAVPYRLKWLIQHSIAAAAGWRLGWVGWATDTAAWFAAGHWTAPSAWVLYVIGALAVALYSRTRSGWRWVVACACAVPVTSTVVGVLLYAPHP
jgi:hypothetical protein